MSAEETQRRKSSAVTAAAKVKVAAAQLAEAQARLARAEVRAPADGIILTRNVEVGQTATPGGEALFRLSEGGEVELRGQVAEQDLPLLKVGQAVNVRLTGTPASTRAASACSAPSSIRRPVWEWCGCRSTPDPNLRPGAFARAEVTVSNAERAVLPQTAVLTDDKGSYVLIVNAQHKVERRAVHVSGMVQNGVTIADGINGKEQVVATAGAFLQEGELVNPVLKDVGPVMRNISAWAIRHPVTPIVLFVVLFFLGVVAFIRLPINLDPDVSFPVVNVTISQPGAAPTEMETQIAQKVEGSISSIGNVRNITTFIVEGQVNIFVQFEIGTPIDRAVTDVRDAVAKVRNDLPQGIMRAAGASG